MYGVFEGLRSRLEDFTFKAMPKRHKQRPVTLGGVAEEFNNGFASALARFTQDEMSQ